MLISGNTISRLSEVKTFSINNPYQVGKNGVTQVTDDYVKYNIGEIQYTTYLIDERTIFKFYKNKKLSTTPPVSQSRSVAISLI